MAPDEKPMSLVLPTTFQVPHLCCLALGHIICPIDSPLLTGHARQSSLAPVTRPNLCWFGFELEGASVDSETLLPQLTTPVPEKFRIILFNQLTCSILHPLQFINRTENPRFNIATITFGEERFIIRVYPHEEAKTYALLVGLACIRFEWSRGSGAVRIDCFQVTEYTASAVQIFDRFKTIFSAVDDLIDGHYLRSWVLYGAIKLMTPYHGAKFLDCSAM